MSRLMSVAMTADAVIERRKTVTRRKGWWKDKNGRRLLHVGDTLTLCRKVQGRGRAVWNGKRRVVMYEPIERLAEVEIVTVWREPLGTLLDFQTFALDYAETGAVTYTPELWEQWRTGEMAREGFPGLPPGDFVTRYFVNTQHIFPDDEVTRIEWRYVCGGGFCECGGCVL